MINEMQKLKGDVMEKERYGEDPAGNSIFDMIYAPEHTFITAYDKGVGDIFTIMSTITNYLADDVPATTIVERVDPLLNAEIEKTFGNGN